QSANSRQIDATSAARPDVGGCLLSRCPYPISDCRRLRHRELGTAGYGRLQEARAAMDRRGARVPRGDARSMATGRHDVGTRLTWFTHATATITGVTRLAPWAISMTER